MDICVIKPDHSREKCPLLTSGTFLDFISDELADPLRAARGIIYGVIAGAMLWAIVVLALLI